MIEAGEGIFLPKNRNVLGKTIFPSSDSMKVLGRQDLIHYRPGDIKFADRLLSLEEQEAVANKRSHHEVFNENYDLNVRNLPSYSYSPEAIDPRRSSSNRLSYERSPSFGMGGQEPVSPTSPIPSPRRNTRFEYSSPNQIVQERRTSNEGKGRNILAESYGTSKEVKGVQFLDEQPPANGPNFSFGEDALHELEQFERNDSFEKLPSSNTSLSAHVNIYSSDSVEPEIVEKREQLINQLKVEQRRISTEGGGSPLVGMHRQTSSSSSVGSSQLSANRQFKEAKFVEEGDEQIYPTKKTNEAGFNRRIQEEFKAVQRRSAGETAPVSKAREKFEFENKVLKRKDRVNEESEEALDLERQFSEVEKTALKQEIDEKNVRSAPVFRSLKSPVIEFREKRSQILSEMEHETGDADSERFFEDIPLYGSQSGLPLPNWRREQLAKKRADKFRQDQENRAQAGIKSELDGYVKMLC